MYLRSKSKLCVLSFAMGATCAAAQSSAVLSRAFEMRYVTSDARASGETDFKGSTEIFDVEQRVAFLRHYADYAKEFFKDPGLDTIVASDDQVQRVLAGIKRQPLPEIRTCMPLQDWKYLGYRSGQDAEERAALRTWQRIPGMVVRDGELVVVNPWATFTEPLPADLTWRMSFSWNVSVREPNAQGTFTLFEHAIDNRELDVAVLGIDDNGHFFYVTDQETVTGPACVPGREYRFRVEIDLDDSEGQDGKGRYNLFIDDTLLADFVPLSGGGTLVNRLRFEGTQGVSLGEIHGVAYEMTRQLEQEGKSAAPYYIDTVLDTSFSVRPSPEDFEKPTYDDVAWRPVPHWPYAHGGERHEREDLYLRTQVDVGDFQRAVLHIETIRPSGEVFVNGTRVAEVGLYPEALDVTQYLERHSTNLIALKVNAYEVRRGMPHTNTDRHTGWFAGMIELNLTEEVYIDDVFAFATDAGNPARMDFEVRLGAARNFEGELRVAFYPWHPTSSGAAAATAAFPVRLDNDSAMVLKEHIEIHDAQLWTTATPNLYKVHVTLHDQDGRAVDDYVFTTGIRTVSQSEGVFRVNDKPEMLLGPLVFQYPNPLERISQWIFCPPEEWIVKQILMVKNQTGNTIRLSVHDDWKGGVNDRRFAQLCDQLGIMLLWQTSGWVRGYSEDLDYDGIAKDARAMRNHPSIVMWQPANHIADLSMETFETTFQTLLAVDQSRLISPTACLRWLADGQGFEGEGRYPGDQDKTWPSWTHPLVGRGEMEQTTGYDHDWEQLRLLPGAPPMGSGGMRPDVAEFTAVRSEYLASPTHAFFDFENEESIGQPNWSLYKGKPMYKIYSYERDYDVGTIGRVLTFDEWEEHQAYQAFSAYEAYRKKRWLGYDGLNWCCLRGGPNTATYMKPLVGYYDRAKLAYHTVGMALQRVLAGSKNVDTAYGPGDEVPLVILNLGDARTVDVEVVARHLPAGREAARTIYRAVELQKGRTSTVLPSWKPELEAEGYYAFEYTVLDQPFP